MMHDQNSNHKKSAHPSTGKTEYNKNISGTSPQSKKFGSDGKKSLKILIVDDNKDSAMTLAWLLESLEHEVFPVHDAGQGLVLAKKISPDVLLLDLGLPKMNGYQLCQKLKAFPNLKNSLFIAQTGWGEKEHHEASFQAGFDHHLVKPVNFEILQKLLKIYIASKNLRSGS